ncbi:hypothetical protein PC116_g20344 [Phytophthora cactorum]|uniref:Uncharacterized protein n=1 Tax=Phytophthora cactorum TaxID=29920 RepID=A0A329SSJ7_9STRA|nr:hypothetical protein PC116_g20344 [Phytophthora cactorum]RAW39619.1 hypothetical protein PC110_g4171 [Phytophthora cactorum]
MRTSFQPTSDQEHVHELFIASTLQSKSSDSFFEYVLASSTVQFDTHPGAVGRMYDLRFGRGLSIKHFRRVSFLDKLRNSGIDSTDFAAAAPNAAEPSSWADLGSTTRSFANYCREMCDVITIRVAEVLDQFVSEVEGWQQYQIADLPLLVRSIDAVLKRYPDAATHDVFHLTATRLLHQPGSRFLIQSSRA